jgi:putative ABC transport system substrate-binding protein
VSRVVAVALGLAFASTLAAAQTRIAVVGPDEEPRFSQVTAGLRQGLADHGYRGGVLQIVQGRTRRGDAAAARAGMHALDAHKPAVLFIIGSALVGTAREVFRQTPIVFITPGDPAAAGLVDSLAKPGRNVTAMTFEYPELSGKRVELMREVMPKVAKVLVLYDSRDASPRQGAAAARAAAAKLGLTLLERDVRSVEDIERGLRALAEADALLGIPGGITSAHYAAMIREATAHRRPAFFHARSQDTNDALLTYGADDVEIARQAARLVDKVLKGANAGDLPVERPTTLTLTVNLKIARALGIAVPAALLLRAEEVIE